MCIFPLIVAGVYLLNWLLYKPPRYVVLVDFMWQCNVIFVILLLNLFYKIVFDAGVFPGQENTLHMKLFFSRDLSLATGTRSLILNLLLV